MGSLYIIQPIILQQYLLHQGQDLPPESFLGALEDLVLAVREQKYLLFAQTAMSKTQTTIIQIFLKLKENIVDANSPWNDIKALRVRNYNFKEETNYSTHTQIGLVAQEVETVSPGLVSESPDTDDKGNDLGTTTKAVNYSVLYMKAVKALQEAMERIETLETKVAALEEQ